MSHRLRCALAGRKPSAWEVAEDKKYEEALPVQILAFHPDETVTLHWVSRKQAEVYRKAVKLKEAMAIYTLRKEIEAMLMKRCGWNNKLLEMLRKVQTECPNIHPLEGTNHA